MKVRIGYTYNRNGREQFTEVETEAPSVAAATNKFKNQFAGKFNKVISANESKRPPRV